MPSFQPFFMKSNGQPINYEGKILHMMDTICVLNADAQFLVVRESTNSEWRQGISVWTKGGAILLCGKEYEGFGLWEDTAPKEVKLRVLASELYVKNVWEAKDHRGTPVIHSWHHGAAMIIEKLPNGSRRYRCNDGHPDENFDDIVFRIEPVRPGMTDEACEVPRSRSWLTKWFR